MRLRKNKKSDTARDALASVALVQEETKASLTEALDALAKTGDRLNKVIEAFNEVKEDADKTRQVTNRASQDPIPRAKSA